MLLEEYKHKHDETEELNKMQDAKKGQVAEKEAISNIEKAFESVDGRNDGSDRQMKPVAKPRGIQYSAQSTKKYGTLAGVPFVEWIVPAGNPDIRPANPMKARYITIHETANTALVLMLKIMRNIYTSKQLKALSEQLHGILL